MSDFVDYTRDLMDAAKGFLTKGEAEGDGKLQQAYFRSSILQGFSFLEAHLNYLANHFQTKNSMFTVQEQGVLLQREVKLKSGAFTLTTSQKFSRINDRIEIILAKCTANLQLAKEAWFSKLISAIQIRNDIAHPTNKHEISRESAFQALESIISCVNALYLAVFKKPLPYSAKTMDSGFNF